MKTILKGLLVIALMGMPLAEMHAQLYVRVRPLRPRVVVTTRPVAPSPRHVWVEEDWIVRKGVYRWHGGYWAAPPRQGLVWVPGHWRSHRRGNVWVPGRWR